MSRHYCDLVAKQTVSVNIWFVLPFKMLRFISCFFVCIGVLAHFQVTMNSEQENRVGLETLELRKWGKEKENEAGNMDKYLNVQTKSPGTFTAKTVGMRALKCIKEWCFSTANNRWRMLSRWTQISTRTTRIPLNTFQASSYLFYTVHLLAQNGDTQRIRPSWVERLVEGTFIMNKSVFVLRIF